jgi:hypothetical protein
MAGQDELTMTFKLNGTPEALAAIEQLRRAMQQAGRARDTQPMAQLKRAVSGISPSRPNMVPFGNFLAILICRFRCRDTNSRSKPSGTEPVSRLTTFAALSLIWRWWQSLICVLVER